MGRLVYVLNADGAGEITGFILDDGDLIPLNFSTRALSGASVTMPAQVKFSPDGEFLVVTEKETDLIDTFLVTNIGLVSDAIVSPSSGETPFGFCFTQQGELIVSEAFDGAADASAVSSYAITGDGALDVISASVPTTETAACWIAITRNNRFTYTTNTGSGTVTGYRIDEEDGSLEILDEDGVTAETGADSAPTDVAVSKGSKFLYVLNSGTGEIDIFKLKRSTGSLTPIGSVGGLPPNGTGLVAR
jgi:6-phosphogluconolactonase (cycloisomerase 2 family)